MGSSFRRPPPLGISFGSPLRLPFGGCTGVRRYWMSWWVWLLNQIIICALNCFSCSLVTGLTKLLDECNIFDEVVNFKERRLLQNNSQHRCGFSQMTPNVSNRTSEFRKTVWASDPFYMFSLWKVMRWLMQNDWTSHCGVQVLKIPLHAWTMPWNTLVVFYSNVLLEKCLFSMGHPPQFVLE